MRTIRDDDDSDAPVSLGDAIAHKETDAALLVQLNSGAELWVPKSQIHEDSACFGCREDEDEGELIVRRWWAEQKGLP